MFKKTTKVSLITVIALFALSVTSVRSYAQTVKSQIQKMAGWQSCVACAGANAAGPGASISTATSGSPTLSGTSRVFNISSSHPYADALWWKQVGAVNSATNLRYDLDFYVTAPQNAQALEFDTNQANGHMRFIFGSECNIASGHWDVWGNTAGNWLSTGIPCARPAAFKWHHLTWEYKRTATTLTYIAVTLDGVKHYVNRTYTGRRSSVNELNIAIQLDMRSNHAAFGEWIDNAKLTVW